MNLVCWANLTVNQWAAMNVDGWATLPVGNLGMTCYTYTYDPIGNRTSSIELTGDRVTWAYDPTSQVTKDYRTGAGAYRNTYSYDPAGNRQALKDGTDITTYVYDMADRLQVKYTTTERTTYTFSPCGNQTRIEAPDDVITTFQYDLENRQISVETEDGITTYTYNALGERVQRETDDGTTTEFLGKKGKGDGKEKGTQLID